jgi:TonB family protein
MTFSEWSSWKSPSREGLMTKMILISLGLHLLILALFLNIFSQGSTKKKLEPAYIVNLVSSPGEESPVKPVSQSPPSPPLRRIETEPIPLPKPLPKKITEKKEDHSREIEKALEQLKKEVQQKKSLDNTLGQLEKKVKEEHALEKALRRIEGKNPAPKTAPTTAPLGTGSIASTVPGSRDGVGVEFQLYHGAIRSQIKKNWVLPEGLIKKSDISAEVLIRIARSGRIEDYRFERKSGVEAFDQEVLRTLKRSDPLPPLPGGYPKGNYEIILTFHSKDLSGN